jgi:co-chaperonin GroES (HSP10)
MQENFGTQKKLEVDEFEARPKDNSYTIIDNRLAIEAKNTRLVIIEDEFKTGYECKTCNGNLVVIAIQEVCPMCKSTGYEKGFDGLSECRICKGRKGVRECGDCKGKGGLLVAPDTAKRRPTTGKVTSIGNDVKDIKVGAHVLYQQHAGSAITLRGNVVLRIIHEDEVIACLYGVATLEQAV